MASPQQPEDRSPRRSRLDVLCLLLAQGLGTGRSPVAPGTVGSFLGLLWFGLLSLPGSTLLMSVGIGISCLAAVPICARAERLLGMKDPGSVVLDEIVALPIGYLGVWCVDLMVRGEAPGPALGWTWQGCGWLGSGFVLFRLLDALKPPPIGRFQDLPGGWGIVADDVAAALVTGVVLGGARWLAFPG